MYLEVDEIIANNNKQPMPKCTLPINPYFTQHL